MQLISRLLYLARMILSSTVTFVTIVKECKAACVFAMLTYTTFIGSANKAENIMTNSILITCFNGLYVIENDDQYDWFFSDDTGLEYSFD